MTSLPQNDIMVRVTGVTEQQDVPIFRDEEGQSVLGMPESYGWFDAFMDRRTYAATAGGAGHTWFGFRNPMRVFYDWANGSLEGAEQDPKWMEYIKEEEFKNNILRNTRSNIGLSERVIQEDFGEKALENALSESVSNDNFMSRVTYMLDAAESRRRIDAYDATQSWTGYLTTKTLSGALNYVASDAPTAAITALSFGSGTALSTIATAGRGTGIMARIVNTVPAVNNASKAMRGWAIANKGQYATTLIGLSAADGAASGYYYWDGVNRDQRNLFGEHAILDSSPLDEVGLGLGLGAIGGLWSYRVNSTILNRTAAIETLAMNNAVTGLPTEAGLNYATRVVLAHERLIKQLGNSGIRQTIDRLPVSDPQRIAFQQLMDVNGLVKTHGLGPETIDEIVDTMRRENITSWDDVSQLIQAPIVREHNANVAFRQKVREILDAAGIVYNPDDIDYTAHRDLLIRGARRPDGTVVEGLGQMTLKPEIAPSRTLGAGQPRLTLNDVMGKAIARMRTNGVISDTDAGLLVERLNRWLQSRNAAGPMDFYRWAWLRKDASEQVLVDEVGQLLRFVNDSTADEMKVLARYGYQGDFLDEMIDRARLKDWDTNADVPLNVRGTMLSNSALFNNLPESMKPIIREIDDLLVLLGREERQFYTTLTDTSAGHPRARMRAYVDSKDNNIVAKIDRLFDKLEKSIPQGRTDLRDILVRHLDFYNHQKIRNDLLRARLKNGMIAEDLDLLNTHSLHMGKASRFQDGSLPLRTSAGVRGMSGVDVDTETFAPQSNKAFNDAVNTVGNAKDIPETSMQIYVRQQKREISAARVVTSLANTIKGMIRSGTTPSTDLSTNLAIIQSTLLDQDKRIPITEILDLLKKDGLANDLGVLDINALNKLATSLDPVPEAGTYGDKVLKRVRENINNKYGGNEKTRDTAMRLMDFDTPDEWSFAVVNAISRQLEDNPLLSQTIGRLHRLLYNMSDWATGANVRQLWFNTRGAAQTGTRLDGMDSFNRVLFFSNLIDTPHTLRRDFGNIIDMRLFSAQQLRHINARDANRFITEYKALLREGFTITPDDERAVINMLLNRSPDGASPAQRRLYDAAQDFYNGFRGDIEAILRRSNYFNSLQPNFQNALDNAVTNTMRRMLLGSFDRGAVLINRGRIKDIIGRRIRLVIDDTITRMETGGVSRIDDAIIANAQTRAQLREALTDTTALTERNNRAWNSWSTGGGTDGNERQLADILELLSDDQIANMRTADDFMTAVRRLRDPATDTIDDRLVERINRRVDEIFERDIDPSQGFTINKTKLESRSTYEFAGFRANLATNEDRLIDDILQEMEPFRPPTLAQTITDFAQGTGVRLRMQAQISRHIGDVNIFRMLRDTREHLIQVARNIERMPNPPRDATNLYKEVTATMDLLEQRMAHGLGFVLENPTGQAIRSGALDTALRFHTSTIRVTNGGRFGLPSLFSDVPRAIFDTFGRNGFRKTLKDFFRTIFTREEVNDISAALEQYTYKYNLAVDNEVPAQAVRVPSQMGPLPDALPIGTLADVATDTVRTAVRGVGNIVGRRQTTNIRGIEASRLQQGGSMRGGGVLGGATRTAARTADTIVDTAEFIGDANTRLGGLQYVTAFAKELSVRGIKRQFGREINNIIAFAKELRSSNLRNIPWEQRLPAFQALANKHGLSTYFASRLNHHGLLNVDDLLTFKAAMKGKGIMDDGVYVTHRLRNEMDRVGGRTRNLDNDEFFRRMTTYLEEETNRNVNMASLIGTAPDAGIARRFFYQFSGYTRGWQHQMFMRGAQDDNTGSVLIRMLIPVVMGDIAYNHYKRVMSGGMKGNKTPEQGNYEEMQDWEKNWEVKLFEQASKIPFYGGSQSILFTYGINPLANSLSRETKQNLFGDPGRYFGPSTPFFGSNKTFAEALPTPYNGIYDQIFNYAETFSDNPYLDNSIEYGYGFPNGYLYTPIPGKHTWQLESFMRIIGEKPDSYNPRAEAYDRRKP